MIPVRQSSALACKKALRLGFEHFGIYHWTLEAMSHATPGVSTGEPATFVSQMIMERVERHSLARLDALDPLLAICHNPALRADVSVLADRKTGTLNDILHNEEAFASVLEDIRTSLCDVWSVSVRAHFDLGVWLFGLIEIGVCVCTICLHDTNFNLRVHSLIPAYYPQDPSPLLLNANPDHTVAKRLIEASRPIRTRPLTVDDISRARHYCVTWYYWYCSLLAEHDSPDTNEGSCTRTVATRPKQRSKRPTHTKMPFDPLYDCSNMPWHDPEPPSLKEQSSDELGEARVIDCLLMTATPVELKQVLWRLRPPRRRRDILKIHVEGETYYVGRFGACRAALFQSTIGTGGPGGATLAAKSALDFWNPYALIMIGVAFGIAPEEEHPADILIAEQIVPYEHQRVSDKPLFRDPLPASGYTLFNRFRGVIDWKFKRPDDTLVSMHLGPVLSGSKLIDSAAFKENLIGAFPTAIGGEMEGAGVYAAAARLGVEWILVKGVCDWADGGKHDGYQEMAAAAATDLVHHVLSDKTVFHGLSPARQGRPRQPSRTRPKKATTGVEPQLRVVVDKGHEDSVVREHEDSVLLTFESLREYLTAQYVDLDVTPGHVIEIANNAVSLGYKTVRELDAAIKPLRNLAMTVECRACRCCACDQVALALALANPLYAGMLGPHQATHAEWLRKHASSSGPDPNGWL